MKNTINMIKLNLSLIADIISENENSLTIQTTNEFYEYVRNILANRVISYRDNAFYLNDEYTIYLIKC